jgi:NO-binding membrane sensor protein with MHYT domain/two-component sensor histidine kinase
MEHMAAVNLIGSYNYALVALSVVIAVFASYAALDLAGRVTAASGWTRAVWLLGGAGAMGTGIWSMHYIGMLAFILPIPVAYHWPTVLLSLLAAILASVVALGVVSRKKMSALRALAGSVLMGAGISSMHYIGMAAMRVPAVCHFDFLLVVLSVVFAILISLAALWITFYFRDEKRGIAWEKLAGAVVMGAAIPVMHYTGMAAASFAPSGTPADLFHAVNISTLGTAGIAAVTFIVLGLALLTSWMDRRFAAQTLELQEAKLQQSEAYLSEAQQLGHTGSFGWRVSTGEIIWSAETFRIFQYDPTTKPTVELVLQRVHTEDAALVKQTIERASQDGKDFDHEYRLVMPDGSIKYVRVVAHALRNEPGGIEFVGAVMDVSEQHRRQMLLAGEKRLLEMIAKGESRALILDALCRLFEELAGESLSSILLMDPNANRLRHGAAPSLPKTYTDAIDGLLIGPSVGSCGTAAYRREPVIVGDIATDPLWADYRVVALAHGLRACWSSPILSPDGRVLGTFATYYREPRTPTPQEHSVIDRITHLASIAVEREQSEQALLQQTNLLEDLAGRLIHAQEEERSRIGRELHDHISQTLGVLTIKIDQLRADGAIPPAVGAALEELRRDMSNITDDVHRLSHRLHSSTLDYLGLVPALQKLAAEFSERHAIAITFAHESLPPSLPSDVALCLFRIAEESLTNIAKHSEARSASIQVAGAPDGIHLKIEDAGTGFDMTNLGSKAGLGFVSMQERLRVLHGTIHVDSKPSRGTSIDAWVPATMLTGARNEAASRSEAM